MAFLDTSKERISWLRFNEIYGEMVLFFKAKTSESIDRQYFKRVRFYPEGALSEGIESYIDNNRPIPSNFPSPNDLANICADWLNDHPAIKESMIVYDSYEDLDFPLRHLETAFKNLIDNGVEKFETFCRSIRMPSQDRERVVCKAMAVASKENNQELKNIINNVFNSF